MAAYAEEAGIDYPIAIDVGGATTGAFAVDSYPDYYVIDRAGNLRVADLQNSDLERTVQVLLAEEAPRPVPAAIAKSAATAKFKDKRILVAWGDEAAYATQVEGAKQQDADIEKFLFNEYEVVQLTRAAQPKLAAALGVMDDRPAVTVLDAGGALLGRMGIELTDCESFTSFLHAHRVPQKDAEVLWRDALAEAKRANKRVLVHLGAPW